MDSLPGGEGEVQFTGFSSKSALTRYIQCKHNSQSLNTLDPLGTNGMSKVT